MRAYLAIAIGGTLGCWARYAMTDLVQTIYGREFPYATLAINVLGSFLMGFLFIETIERLTISPYLRIGILTGFLGDSRRFLHLQWRLFCLPSKARRPKACSTLPCH